MNTYFFHIAAEPLPGNEQTEHIASALAQVWMVADDPRQAENKALAVVAEFGWAPLKVEDSFVIDPEILAVVDQQFLTQYEKARSFGYVVLFHFMARKGLPADDQPRPLTKPKHTLLQ